MLVEVILPELLTGYRQRRPYCARWLAFFLRNSRQISDVLRLRGMPAWYPPDVFREAIALDSSDRQAAHALIQELGVRFGYTTHEVPLGVLLDFFDDTETWRRELDEFERLIQRYPTGKDYTFELAGWRFHCDAWPRYLEQDEFDSYAEYLASGDSERGQSCRSTGGARATEY